MMNAADDAGAAHVKADKPAWRRWLVFIARLVFGLVVVAGGVVLIQTVLRDKAPALAVFAAIAFASVVLLSLFVRATEGKWARAFALPAAPGGLLLGALLGALASAASVGALWALGFYRITSIAPSAQWPALIVGALGVPLGSAFLEETLFRGVIVRQLARQINPAAAIIISAVIFGLLHALNPNATLAAGIGLILQAGVMLALAYIVTRSLWLAIGLHFAWNFMQAAIVGGALSGSRVHSIVTADLHGPALLSGGAFGIEGSIITTAICALAGLGFFFVAQKRGVKWFEPMQDL